MTMADQHSPLQRAPMVIALILAISFVVAALVGTKVVWDKARLAPVTISDVPAPLAESPECTTLLRQLPDRLNGYDRVRVAAPIPPGSAAWATDSAHRITLRCGIDLPAQYTVLTTTFSSAGTNWMTVTDTTTGSSLASYFTTATKPVVAITTDHAFKDPADALQKLTSALSQLPVEQAPTHPVPLAEVAHDPEADDKACAQLITSLPEHITATQEYTRRDTGQLNRAGLNPTTSAVWTSPGLEPVVIVCGLKNSNNYAAGARLEQVNDVAWFPDTLVTPGTTAGIWYAQGWKPVVALSMPSSAGNTTITILSTIIADTLQKTGS